MIRPLILSLYKGAKSPLQNLFFDKIQSGEIKIHETKEVPFTIDNNVYLNHTKIITNLTRKIISNHECTHALQNESPVETYKDNATKVSLFIIQLLKENHAFTLQNLALSYDELKEASKISKSGEFESKYDKVQFNKAEKFFNVMNRVRKKEGANPKNIFKRTLQWYFISEFDYAKSHFEDYKNQSEFLIENTKQNKYKYDDLESIFKGVLLTLFDSVSLNLKSFPFDPHDLELQKSLEKENKEETISIFDKDYLDKCIKAFFENPYQEVPMVDAIQNLTELSERQIKERKSTERI
ncbi:MAG: hypothetical protein ACTSXV_01190 [Alphaproteobacteria bacterium]